MSQGNEHWHRRLLENKSGLFAVLSVAAIAVGSVLELVPMFQTTMRVEQMNYVTPYTPLEVAGRDIYTREGCYLCHSQWVRPFRSETLRYGVWSQAEEYVYDRPFQWGSRRIGPDIHRVGGKYNDAWHYEHMMDPRSTSPGSIMPRYQWLADWSYSSADIRASVEALAKVGTPYDQTYLDSIESLVDQQASEIVASLAESNITVGKDKEIVALIAYLQRLGTDRKRWEEALGGEE